jgi:hypothetical protein
MDGDSQQPGNTGNWQYKPEDTGTNAAQKPVAQTPQVPVASVQQTNPAPAVAATAETTDAAADTSTADSEYDESVDDQAEDDEEYLPAHPEVAWTATEFIAHEKSTVWYAALFGVAVVLALLVYLLSRDKVSAGIIVVVGIIFGVTAGRKPRSVQYLVDQHGITVNRAFRSYTEFKSFALVEEAAVDSIIFMPLKRFTLPLSLYVEPQDVDAVVAKLSDYLPLDPHHDHDLIDQFVQRIHF